MAAPSAAPAPPSSPSLGSGNFYDADPGYVAQLAYEQAQAAQLDAALKAAREQGLIQFGDPALAAAFGVSVDPTILAAINANSSAGNTTLARLQQQRNDQQQAIVNALAAHGIIRSGDLGYKTQRNEQAYGQAYYDAQQAALGNLNNLSSQTVAQKQNLHAGTISALQNAYTNYVNNPANFPAADAGTSANAPDVPAAAPSAAPRVAAPKPVSSLGAPVTTTTRVTARSTERAPTKIPSLPNPYVTGQKLRG